MSDEGGAEGWPLIRIEDDGVAKQISRSDLSVEDQAALKAYLARLAEPRLLSEHERRILELNRRPHPVVGFVKPGTIPPPALALAIRDPAATISRLIVLEEATTDRTFDLARRALIGMEMVDEIKGEGQVRRFLRVLPDESAVDEHGDERFPAFTAEISEDSKSRDTGDVQRLLEFADEEVDLAGIGHARVVRP